MIVGSILQEDITILTICIYVHQTTEQSIKICKAKRIDVQRNRLFHYYSWRFQHPSPNQNRQIQETENHHEWIDEFNNAVNSLDKMDIYTLFHPMTAESTFFLRSYRTFTKIEHNQGHKTHINKFKRI